MMLMIMIITAIAVIHDDAFAHAGASLRGGVALRGLLRGGVATPGKLDEGVVAWHPPSLAAQGLLLGAARGERTVYVPWSQVRIFMMFNGRRYALSRRGAGAGASSSARSAKTRTHGAPHANTHCL